MKLFKQKKLYKIQYRFINYHTTIVEAKDEHQALKKFRRLHSMTENYDIYSIEEY
jgi:hypothetical protein